MSDEHDLQEPDEFDIVNFEDYSDEADEDVEEYYDDDEYEEIDPAEIDAVVNVLNDLMEKVQSQTIKDYLEATCSDIACLMDEIEDDEAEAA
jgi:hypothetical protein